MPPTAPNFSPAAQTGGTAPVAVAIPVAAGGRRRCARLSGEAPRGLSGREVPPRIVLPGERSLHRRTRFGRKTPLRRTLLAALVAIVTLAACDKASTLRPGELPEGTLLSIGALKSLCTAPGGCVITRSVAVRGVVTANDHYGEFSREIVVEDATGGLRIAIDRARLSDLFPLGSLVSVQCNGLALGLYGGCAVLGGAPDVRYGVARIPFDAIDRHLRCEGHGGMPEVEPIDPDALRDPARVDTYVRLDGLRFTDAGATWCDLDPETLAPLTTERTAVDAAGRRLTVRTLSTCRYAEEPLPAGEVSLCGIVACFDGAYSLRITARRILAP